jgi:CheY-like chemotaxis protein
MMAREERILVVDDEEDTRTLLCTLLESEGYGVETAADGEAALERVQATRPDLILLDIMMPQMDGLEVCDHLRFDPATRDVPIIFLTAKHDPVTQSRASILDAYAYIEKPFAPEDLLAEIRNCLNVFGREAGDNDRPHASA